MREDGLMALTLLRNGAIYAPADPFATAMLVDGPAVAWVGSEGAADAHADGVDTVVDLDGALVTPAFVDAHVHATSTGLALEGLDLTGCQSLAALLARVEEFARAAHGGVVQGHGWDETTWPEHRPPTKEELDRASYGGVVYLSRIDVHSAVVSSALLAAAPEIRSADGYDESGRVSGEAHHVARRIARETLSPAQRRAAQRATRRRAAELGIGCFHELAGPDISSIDDLRELVALAESEPGPDVLPYWGELGGVERARELGALGAAGDLFADGAIGSHTACLRSVYADEGHTGHAYLTAAQVRDHVVACTQAGLQAGFHAIGDGALQAVVAGFAAAAGQVGVAAIRAARHRIEHVEMVDAHMISTLGDLGVVASVQPAFDRLWGGREGMYAERLGADRAMTLNPFADLAAAGVALALGSDAPVTPLDPWGTIRAAAWHHNADQRMSVRAAFAAHTRGGWRAAGRDDHGVLAPGAPATYAVWRVDDLVVQAPDERIAAWSTDPRAGVPGLPDLGPASSDPVCLRTVVRGSPIFDAGQLDHVR
jgi:predicted amidohydrolase YtcJ